MKKKKHRYYIDNTSRAGHSCCFKYSVVDSEREDKYNCMAVCECFEQKDAERIVKLLNADSKRKEI